MHDAKFRFERQRNAKSWCHLKLASLNFERVPFSTLYSLENCLFECNKICTRSWRREPFSRLYSVHTLDFFFANCHSCLTTYFHISKLWQLYAHNLLMSISKHSEEKLSLLVHFYWEMVNKSLRTSYTQCLKISQKCLVLNVMVKTVCLCLMSSVF